MAKRVIAATSDVAAWIDQGAAADAEAKNNKYRCDGLKTLIKEAVGPQMEDGEKFVEVHGNVSKADVMASTKVVLACADFDALAQLREGFFFGSFGKALSLTRQLQVAPADMNKALKVLAAAGISATINDEWKVSGPAFQKLEDTGDTRKDGDIALLRQHVKEETTFSVTFGKKPKGGDNV